MDSIKTSTRTNTYIQLYDELCLCMKRYKVFLAMVLHWRSLLYSLTRDVEIYVLYLQF